MPEAKICSKCTLPKIFPDDFYSSKGKFRSECKSCTIKKNIVYQKIHKTWQSRFVDRDSSRSYMVEYYSRNKEKFAKYRKEFKEKYPTYYRDYNKNRKSIKT